MRNYRLQMKSIISVYNYYDSVTGIDAVTSSDLGQNNSTEHKPTRVYGTCLFFLISVNMELTEF